MIDRYINIAIDGPSGAGKSSCARLAAAKLGFIYVDTGALYRSLALAVLRAGLPLDDESAVRTLLPSLRLELGFVGNVQHVFLNGEDVSEEIRDPKVSRAVSAVARQSAVREHLLDMQREIAARQNCILDGRDIGTVVLPDAQLKIFLTASPEERARRRYAELQAKGNTDPYEKVLAEINQRDAQDAGREIAPLAPAPDSRHLDSTGLTPEETVGVIVRWVREIAG